MIRFKEVWELYEKGNINDEEALDNHESTSLNSKQGTKVARIIDDLVTLETSKIDNEIKLINPAGPNLDSLEGLLGQITEAEKKVFSFLNLNINDHYIYGHIIRVTQTGDSYDRLIIDSFNRLYDEFQKSSNILKTSEGAAVVSEARDQANKRYIDCKGALDLASKRGIVSELNKPKVDGINQYAERKDRIDVINRRIGSLYRWYDSLKIDRGSIDDLQLIRERIKNKWYSKSSLVKDCNSAGYAEGIDKLKELERDVEKKIKEIGISPKIEYEYKVKKLESELAEAEKIHYQEASQYKSTISGLRSQLTQLKQERLVSRKETSELKGRIDDVASLLESKKRHEAEQWNNKYPISDKIVYTARDRRKWDVRDFIQADNAILKEAVEQHQLRGQTLDDIAYKCMRWVQNNIQYTPDPQQTGHPEEWLFPTETLQTKKGDCEDGANLMISLMRNAGVPAYRVKNACGLVETENGEGGHSWPICLREADEGWVILDWSYKPADKPIEQRELAKNRTDYKEIWFTFNDEHSWTQHSIDVSKDYLRKPIASEKEKKGYAAVPKQKDSSFVLCDYLRNCPEPSSYHLLRLKDILEGRTGLEDLFERLNQFSDYLATMQPSNSGKNKKFLEYLFHGLEQDISSGLIGRSVGASTYKQGIVEDTLNQLKDYLAESETAKLSSLSPT